VVKRAVKGSNVKRGCAKNTNAFFYEFERLGIRADKKYRFWRTIDANGQTTDNTI